MSTPFDRPLYGYRFVQTQRADTLQKVAARELGDAGRWAEIIVLNGMVDPYLTDDPDAVKPGVFLNGDLVTVPASSPGSQTNDPATVFGQDILLTGGKLTFVNGDIAVVSGLKNLNQALENALGTDQGELLYHTTYGSLVRQVIGSKNGPAATLIAANFAKQVVEADERIDSVTSSVGTASGDSIDVAIDAQTIQGTTSSTGVTY